MLTPSSIESIQLNVLSSIHSVLLVWKVVSGNVNTKEVASLSVAHHAQGFHVTSVAKRNCHVDTSAPRFVANHVLVQGTARNVGMTT